MFSDFDRLNCNSPPSKQHLKLDNSATTPYTPGGQKRVNPFLKDMEVVKDKNPLTPTKDHPLQDLTDHMKQTHLNDDKDTLSEDDGFSENKMEISTEIDEHFTQNDENKNNISTSSKYDDNQMSTMREYNKNDVIDNDAMKGLSAGNGSKVIRRKKTATTTNAKQQNHRASFPLAKSVLTKSIEKLDSQMCALGSETDSSEKLETSTEKLETHDDPIPEWVIVGESVLIRPYNTSGIVSFIGPTHFQVQFK